MTSSSVLFLRTTRDDLLYFRQLAVAGHLVMEARTLSLPIVGRTYSVGRLTLGRTDVLSPNDSQSGQERGELPICKHTLDSQSRRGGLTFADCVVLPLPLFCLPRGDKELEWQHAYPGRPRRFV